MPEKKYLDIYLTLMSIKHLKISIEENMVLKTLVPS